jgi:hypothetical protein
VTVTNSGAAPTTGAVTVTEALPSLTPVSMLGNNWTCTQPIGPCLRRDALGAGLNYEPITVTVNVPATAPSSVANTATVSGGGETNTANGPDHYRERKRHHGHGDFDLAHADGIAAVTPCEPGAPPGQSSISSQRPEARAAAANIPADSKPP